MRAKIIDIRRDETTLYVDVQYLDGADLVGTDSVPFLLSDNPTQKKIRDVATDQGQTGWGADLWGDILWGDSSGSPVSINSRSVLRFVDLFKDLFSLQVLYENTSTTDSFEILSLYFLWQTSDKPLPPSLRIS